MVETDNLKREVSALEAQLPSEESRKRLEAAIREELESAWRQKVSVISEENERLSETVVFLQEVRKDECPVRELFVKSIKFELNFIRRW